MSTSSNLDYDGINQYLYDGEGRICAVASTPILNMTTMSGCLCNADRTPSRRPLAPPQVADGTRVAKGRITAWSCDPGVNGFQTTSDYILGPGGEQVTEMGMDANSSMAWQHTNVWAGGKLLATYDMTGLHFYFDDPLGTRRVQTDYAGVIERTCASLPYGDGETCTPTPTEHLFTGKERDAESGNDYFGARYYASSMGRFMSPDWAAQEEPVPYADLDDPQSLNLYSYVRNNPMDRVDADGHIDGATADDAFKVEAMAEVACPECTPVIAVAAVATLGVVAYQNRDEIASTLQSTNDKLKKEWEKLWGKPWPKDPGTGRGQEADHIKPKADGGAKSDVNNIQPLPQAAHRAKHKEDFKRWGKRGGKKPSPPKPDPPKPDPPKPDPPKPQGS
jgi:RHS repeat-associated protein